MSIALSYPRQSARNRGSMGVFSREVRANIKSRLNFSSKPWKPVTLRVPLLSSLAILTISLVCALEYLSRLSHRNRGLVFAERDFSASTTFAFLYLPTLIATSYSILWSWVDLDAKRLEPYFQMSMADGAQAKDSLLLHYPFDFVAFVPYRALKKRLIFFPALQPPANE